MQCLINQAIISAFEKGETLQNVQKSLNEKSVYVDINALKQRSLEIKKKLK